MEVEGDSETIRPSTHEVGSKQLGRWATAPAKVSAVGESARCLGKGASGPENRATVQFVPNASWYVPHWTFVRIEFVKSIEHNPCCHSDSETEDLS